jgi:aryl-alcohol dehydrogenase-like predicted oxidoreductase
VCLAARQISVADIMFGGAPISTVPDAEATATVHACLAAGIRHYDSAPMYGDSEDKLGRALLAAARSPDSGLTLGPGGSLSHGRGVIQAAAA